MDPFEEILKRQPFRPVPPDLRAEILAAAQAVPPASRSSSLSRINAWLWPSPYAWAALAAAWLLILGLNLASQPVQSRSDFGPLPPSPEFFAALLDQHRLLEELTPTPPSTRPTPSPRPEPNSPGAMLAPRRPDQSFYV